MKKTLLVWLTILLSHNVMGQVFSYQVPDFFRMRIKSIDEFMDRFNREELPPLLDSNDSELPYKQIVACFNIDSVRHRANEVINFAHRMVDSNIHISFESPNYFCELLCGAKYKGHKTDIILRMIVEKSDNGYCSWVIADAEGEELKMIPERTSSSMRLSPIDNLQDFAELQQMFQDYPKDVANYLYHRWPIDETSVFVALVSHGILKIEEIKNIEYVFCEGGYVFKVKFFNRETNNNGWLIYDFLQYE